MAGITTRDGVDRIVDQWAEQRPELDTEPMAVFGRIYRIARFVGERQEAAYARFRIGRGEFDVLATLRRSGAPFQLSPKALCASLMLSSGGMTGRLDRLEQRGLATRAPHPADRRGLVITLTGTGKAVVDEAVVAGLAAQHEILDQLPAADRAALIRLLRDLLAVVAPEPEPS